VEIGARAGDVVRMTYTHRSAPAVLHRVAAGAALLLAVGGLPGRAAAQDAGGLPVGTRVSPVAVVDAAGRPSPVPATTGRPVLIEFWAAWCDECAALEPRMKAAYARFGRDVDFHAVAVNVNESPQRVFRHAAARALPYPAWYDASGAATRAFEVPATSFVVVLDARRRVVYTGLGGAQDLVGALARTVGSPSRAAGRY
jgi:thiol-disulfide isomerase/thioredoxin